MAKATIKTVGDVGLKLLIGLLFVCIGIEGVANGSGNDLYRAIGDDTINIILGIVLIVCGLLIIVPLFVTGIKPVFTKYSMIIVSVVWILVIIFSDFVYGLQRSSNGWRISSIIFSFSSPFSRQARVL